MSKRYPWAKWTLPAVVDPPTRTCYTIPVPDDPLHKAAFRGALLALASATKWQDDDAHTAREVALVWQEIYDLVVQCEECDQTQESWDEDLTSLCEGLRWNNGKLQAFCCGSWSDVTGQPSQGFAAAPIGSGASQPAAGGGCVTYHGTLQGNGLWLLPTVVSTGDTILLSAMSGATYNPVNGYWYCPDGSQFFAGACTPYPITAGGNPVPAAPSGAIVAKIGSTFYDIHSGTFTVPGGVVSQPVVLQVNYAAIATSSGEIQFDVLVCNNAATTYTHTFNWLLGTQGFSVENEPLYTPQYNGAWASGSGWLGTGAAASGQTLHGVLIKRILPASHIINTAELTYDLTKGTINPGLTNGLFLQLGATGVVTASRPSNTDPNGTGVKFTITPGAYTIDSIYCEVKDAWSASPGSPGSSRLYQLVVTGPGTDPW